jgi:hypothetical protein
MARRLNVALGPTVRPLLHVVLPSIALRSRKNAVPDFPHQAGHHLAEPTPPQLRTDPLVFASGIIAYAGASPVVRLLAVAWSYKMFTFDIFKENLTMSLKSIRGGFVLEIERTHGYVKVRRWEMFVAFGDRGPCPRFVVERN